MVDPDVCRVNQLTQLASVLSEHPGETPVVILLGERRLLIGQRVEVSATLLRAIRRILGEAALVRTLVGVDVKPQARPAVDVSEMVRVYRAQLFLASIADHDVADGRMVTGQELDRLEADEIEITCEEQRFG